MTTETLATAAPPSPPVSPQTPDSAQPPETARPDGTAQPTACPRNAPPAAAAAVPPLAPGALPGLGHAVALLRDPLGFLGSLARHGGVVRVRLGPRTVCVVTDASLVHTLLVARAYDCPRGAVQDTLRTAFGDGLLMSEGQAHRDRRRVIQPAFGPDRMAGYLAVMHQVTEERAARWQPGRLLDVAREMNHLALEIVTRSLFGARLGEEAALAFHRALPDLVKGQIVQSLYPHPALARLPLPVNRRFDAAVRVLNDVVDQAVDRAVDRAVDGYAGQDAPVGTLPALLRAATDPATGRPLTEADVRSEAITMFGAGTETVSTTLTWLIDELLRHPQVEARMLAELDEHLPAGTVPTPEALARLRYTHSVTREVVRLHAPNAFLMRTAQVPVELGPYRIPAGTELLYSLTALHRDPVRYPDPLRFCPERWQDGGAGRQSFLPFGAGKHKCIGEAFAWAELTVAAAAILRRWRPVAVPGARAREVVWTTVQAQGLQVRLAPREDHRPRARETGPVSAPRLPRPQSDLATTAVRHAEWAVGHGLLTRPELPRYQAYALPELIGRAFPRTRGADLDLLVDMLGWYTILDDRFDGSPGCLPAEARAVVEPLIAVVDGTAPSAGEDQLTTAWRELWDRQTAAASPAWRARAAREWQACLSTFPAEAQHRAHGTVPHLGLAETMLLRRHGSCLYPFMNILERVHGADAPAALHADPDLRRLRAHTADAATLINDLYSLDREERQGTAAFNTVLALEHASGCTRSRAAEAVRARIAQLCTESEALRRDLLGRHPAGRWYLDGTRELVDGVQAWTSTSERYR
ncbi:cytochrome P450 [Streptomyces kaniharaensis]|uniref:Cytochrome P450 n=1 Tax=Streptomyces kaniharaensis TaxID=212423 RepID=A0A6N7L6H0_9ACTN|nr:cytochrome P450 [Streptomyces kaniharaensis]MQS17743.1 cytochrome P450 [Streptomyces kaniharaensis]